MDNKLSKPVAEVVSKFGDPEAFGEREIKLLTGIQQMAYGTKFYSQEYVSALKHESAVNWEAAASLNVENQELKKRIAELEQIPTIKPVRIHRDWNRASMFHCGKCDLWKMTIADADGVQTCASCYDAEFLSEWQDYAEAADKRIAELEDAEQKLCAANVTLDARASAAEAKLATPIQIVNYDEFFICHVSGASDDYCKGWVDGRNAAARDVVKAGFTVEDKQ